MKEQTLSLVILPLFYTSIWFLVHYLILGSDVLMYILVIPIIYGFSHCYAANNHSHITLLADEVALPIVIISALIVGGFYMMSNQDSKFEILVGMLSAFGFSWIGGHAILLACTYILEQLKK